MRTHKSKMAKSEMLLERAEATGTVVTVQRSSLSAQLQVSTNAKADKHREKEGAPARDCQPCRGNVGRKLRHHDLSALAARQTEVGTALHSAAAREPPHEARHRGHRRSIRVTLGPVREARPVRRVLVLAKRDVGASWSLAAMAAVVLGTDTNRHRIAKAHGVRCCQLLTLRLVLRWWRWLR